MKIVAVIVGRKGSKRIPGKMWQKINGSSLIERKICQLKKTNVDEIFVGSDDLRAKTLCKKYKVNFILRDKKFCDEKSSTPNDMIKNMLSYISADHILWAHPTNPLIDKKIYNKAINFYKKNLKKNNKISLFSATKIQDHFWKNPFTPLNHNPNEKVHTVGKYLKPVFRQNGGIFIRNFTDMKKDGKFIGKKPLMFEMKETEGWDINYKWELQICNLLSKKNL